MTSHLPVIENFQLLVLASAGKTTLFCPILQISGEGSTVTEALENWKKNAASRDCLQFYDFSFLKEDELIFSRKIWMGKCDQGTMYLVDYPMVDQGVAFFPQNGSMQQFRWSEVRNAEKSSAFSALFDERIRCSRLFSLSPNRWHQRSLTPHHI